MATSQEPQPELPPVPPGILRSQHAYWRDLPELLKTKKRGRWWVAYHGDERIGLSRSSAELYQECRRRGIKNDEFYVGPVEPDDLPPWEPIEIDYFDEGPDELDPEGPSEQAP